MFIKIFTKKKSNLFSDTGKYNNDFKLDNNSENEILNNLKKKIFDADTMNKLNKSTEEQNPNFSPIPKIKLSLENNNNNIIQKKSRKSIVNFNIKNKLNQIKDQITHSKSITSNKLEKKFTYKLQGNNLIKKNYSKLSNEDLISKKSSHFKKTKTMAKSPDVKLKKNFINNIKTKVSFDALSDRIIMKKRKNNSEKKRRESKIKRKNSKKHFKTLIVDKNNNFHNIENKIFNQEGLFDMTINKASKKIATKSLIDPNNIKRKKVFLPKTLFPNDELTMKNLNKLVHKNKIELNNIHKTIREDLFGENSNQKKLNIRATQFEGQIDQVRNATKYELFRIKNKEHFRMLMKRPPVYDSLLSNSEEEYKKIYDHGSIYINPNCLFKKIFDICLIFLFLYDAFINSWLNAKNNGELNYKYEFEISLNFIVEIFYFIDFIMGFFIAYYNNDEVLITKMELIIFNYLKTWCILDFLMAIPFDSILYFCTKNKIRKYSASNYNENNILYLLTFIKKLKFIKILSMDGNNYFISFLNEFEFFTFYGNIYLYFLIFMVLLHNICCVYIIIGKFTYPTWINILNLNYYDIYVLYII